MQIKNKMENFFREKSTLLENFYILKYLLDVNHAKSKIFLFFFLIYLVGILFTLLDGSIYFADNRLGYFEDVPNYFYFFSFYLSVILLNKLKSLFFATFGNDNKENIPRFINCTDEQEMSAGNYSSYAKGMIDKLLLRDRKTKNIFRIFRLLILIAYIIAVFPTGINRNWNFSFTFSKPFFSEGQYFGGYLFNQLKDIFIYVILLPELLWLVTVIAGSTIMIVRHYDKKNKLKIRPLDPDNVGGISQLGKIALYLFYITISPLFHLIATSITLKLSLFHQILYFLYIPFSALIFFLPLLSARRAMKSAKKEELENISKLCSKAFDDYSIQNKNGNISNGVKLKKSIFELRELYQEIKKMSVWPYNFETIAKFMTGFMVPIFVFVVQTTISEKSILITMWDYFKRLLGTP